MEGPELQRAASAFQDYLYDMQAERHSTTFMDAQVSELGASFTGRSCPSFEQSIRECTLEFDLEVTQTLPSAFSFIASKEQS